MTGTTDDTDPGDLDLEAKRVGFTSAYVYIRVRCTDMYVWCARMYNVCIDICKYGCTRDRGGSWGPFWGILTYPITPCARARVQ